MSRGWLRFASNTINGLNTLTSLIRNFPWRATMKTIKTPTTDRPDRSKRPYKKPTLITYGNIREVTKNLGGTVGKNDGGGGNDKTG